MPFDAGAAVGVLILDDSQFRKTSKDSQKSTQNLGKSFFTAQIGVEIFKKALSSATKFVKDAVNITSDLSEANSKLGVIFGDVAKDAEASRQELVKSFGLSQKAATELLGSTGDLLTGFGFAQDTALGLSTEVQKLAVDLASFSNVQGGAEEVSKRLTSALTGEVEGLKAVGIVIRQDTKEFKDRVKTIQESTGASLQQAKAQVILEESIKQSKNAMGDFARTQDTFANAQRTLAGATEDITGIIGTAFLPVLEDATLQFRDLAINTRDFLQSAEGIELLSSIFAGVSSSFAVAKVVIADLFNFIKDNVLSITDNFIGNMDKLSSATESNIGFMEILTGAAKLLSIPFTVLVKIINGVVDNIMNLTLTIVESGQTISTFFKFLKREATFDDVKKAASEAGDAIKGFAVDFKGNVVDLVTSTQKQFSGFLDNTKQTANNYGNIWTGTFSKSKNEFKTFFKDTLTLQNVAQKELIAGATTTGADLQNAWKENLKKLNTQLQKGFDGIGKQIISTTQFIGSAVASQFTAISDVIQQALDNEVSMIQARNDKKIAATEEKNAVELERLSAFYDAKQEALAEDFENGLISEAQFNEQKALLDKEKAEKTATTEENLDAKLKKQKDKARKEENDAKKKQFQANKANQIAGIWIAAGLGIVSAWAQSIAQLGPIAGAIFAGVLTAAIVGVSVAQTVVVGQQQFVPEFAMGGTTSGGPVRMNEAGGEIVDLPDGSLVIPNDISRQIAGGVGKQGGGTQININNPVIREKNDINKMADAVISAMTRRKQDA